MSALNKIILDKPYLAWYIKDKNALSKESVFEHVLNYGDWDDFKKAEKILGVEEAKKTFEIIKSKKRVNLRPQTVNYFENYFKKYA